LKSIPDTFRAEFFRHPCIPIHEIANVLGSCVEGLVAKVDESQASNQLNYLTTGDPILQELGVIFDGSTEAPYSDADNDALDKKVDERFKKNLAPCCTQMSGKNSPLPNSNAHAGDGRVWFQLVKHAQTAKKTIIFVTADNKFNWWRTARLGNQDRAIGPHFDLIRDIEASGKKLLMYTQQDFLAQAPTYLGVAEQPQAIEEVKQLEQSALKACSDAVKATLESLAAQTEPGFLPHSGAQDPNVPLAPKAQDPNELFEPGSLDASASE
jgi:hypothetical protein